jgi:hypothetical protein
MTPDELGISETVDELHRLRNMRTDLLRLVEAQANDEGLWFRAATAPESYLQQELRRLHALIEGYDQ